MKNYLTSTLFNYIITNLILYFTINIYFFSAQNNIANAIKYRFNYKGVNTMSKNSVVVPEAREALNKFKMEAANEVGVNLKNGYNGHLTSREAGSVGGQMVKKMIEQYENSIK